MSVLVSLLSACSILDVVNAFTPDSGSSVRHDVAYGDHPRQRFDVYQPLMPAVDEAVIIFFYGGGWESGNRASYEFIGRKLAALGHIVVVPDYRIYPDVTFPEFVEDGALATAHVIGHLSEIAGQSRPLFLMGHSAGAHIAMLVAVNQTYLRRLGYGTDELAGVIGLAGPYDFLPIESPRLKEIFPTPKARRDAQPINYVDANDPPVFLAHGDRDKRVWLRNSVNMANKLEEEGSEVVLKVYPDVTHAGMIKPFISFLDDDTGLLNDIQRFISLQQAEAFSRRQ